MRGSRHWLAPVAGAWLMLQVFVQAGVPVAFGVECAERLVLLECTCDHPDSQGCPMHHSRARSRTGACVCACRPDQAAALAALIGPAAIPVQSAAFVAVIPPTTGSRSPALPELDAPLPPDAPPPRA